MRLLRLGLLVMFSLSPVLAQENSDGPTDEKAQKTCKEALQLLHEREPVFALGSFKKADKQDGGHCVACQKQMIKYGIELGDWKTAEQGAEEMVAAAKDDTASARAHIQFAVIFFQEGLHKQKDEYFNRAHEEANKALAAHPNFPEALYIDGLALAHLQQDDAAKARFQEYVRLKTTDDPNRQRALRYISRPELVRARMAPPFAVTTTDGQKISFDDLQGKVVLLDFWATWCGPCREALPHLKNVTKKFQGEPLVILSVSLDSDELKWKDFITQKEMSWPQYRDGGFEGSVAKLFGVKAIPHTFTIDADGVLQDEHIGDASIGGKLKKLLARARDLQSTAPSAK
jgi:thiol-disulfide isomerase/thioredoxin